MIQDRDPRTDPRRGDLFSKPQKGRRSLLRRVTYRGYGRVSFDEFRDGDEKSRRRDQSWETFSRWCEGADVLERGEE